MKENLKNCTVNLEVNSLSKELICELAAVKLTTHKTSIYIVGVYRPDTNFDESVDTLSSMLDTIPTWNNPVILMGDINVDCLKPDDRKTTTLQNFLITYNIVRLQLPPTRITPFSRTSIDMVCTNHFTTEPDVSVINTFISDHTGQLTSLKIPKTSILVDIINHRQLTDNNLRLLNRLLKQESWNDVINSWSVEESYNIFLETLTYNMDIACPYKKTRKRQTRKSHINFDNETKLKRSQFLQAQEEYLLNGTEESKTRANDRKKIYDQHLKAQRRAKTSNYIQEADNKSKAMWQVINKERCKDTATNDTMQLNINGSLTTDPITIAEHLNTFFVNSADNTLAQASYDGPRQICRQTHLIEDTLTLWPTTPNEVKNVLLTMKAKQSAGLDGISSKLLKVCCESLTMPLTNIINKSFTQQIFPSKLKESKVYPKHKKGDKTQETSYRPISLLPAISKLIEKIVLIRLIDHLARNALIPEEQHGFTTGKSTSTAVIKIVEYLIKTIEMGNTSTAIFLDFSKAFDCLNYDMLLRKLGDYGVRGAAASWFRSYLHGRTQVVEIKTKTQGERKGIISNPLPIKRGVPQGSVLGPILYAIFVSDFPTHLNQYCSMLMYADDTVLLIQNEQPINIEIESYIAINMALEYCQANDLVLNSTKTQQLIMGRKKDEVIELPEAERLTHIKYLGVTIDEHLSWNAQVDQLCVKLSTAIYVLRRLNQIASTEVVRCGYYALFESHLRYGVAVWGNSSNNNLQRVLVLQKKAVRILAGLGPQETCRGAFKQLRILTTATLYILETILYAKQQDLARGTDNHSYNTRTAHQYILPAHRLTLFEKQPSYAGTKFLRILPQDLKDCEAQTKLFKTKLINWLLDNPFYSIEEFINWKTNSTNT